MIESRYRPLTPRNKVIWGKEGALENFLAGYEEFYSLLEHSGSSWTVLSACAPRRLWGSYIEGMDGGEGRRGDEGGGIIFPEKQNVKDKGVKGLKSNVCKLELKGQGFSDALSEVEKTAEYNHLGNKEGLQLRLLAEELLGMARELLGVCEAEFWVEQEGRRYELHLTAAVHEAADSEFRKRVLSVSSTGENAAAKGVMGKIRSVVEEMIADAKTAELPSGSIYFGMGVMSGIPVGPAMVFDKQWSLNQYKKSAEEELKKGAGEDEWDELEKSIVAKLANDVIVGVKGKQVTIIVKKTFVKNFRLEEKRL